MSRVSSISPGLLAPIAPVFVQAGTAATGTGAVTPTIPTNVANDIIIVFAQSGNQAITMTTAGYTQIGPQPGNGTAAAAASNRLALFWKRSAGAEGNPTVADSGDHTTAQVIVIRGCVTTGDPFQFLSSGVKTTASTTLTATGGITGIDNMLVLVFAAQSVASNSAQFSAWANSSLVSITEGSDDSGTGGTGGGGVAMAYGVKTTAGSVGSTTATEANSTVDSFSTIAMVPANVTAINSSPSTTWVFEYTNSVGTDLAVIPANAVAVDIIAIGGGGAGGSGIASTAAGGGGGGGGAWTKKFFKASVLTSPLQITVGGGGIGGSTKSLASGTVVKNNNGSGNTIVSAGRGALPVDASSNSGGPGGAGGSAGNMAPTGASGQGTGGAGGGTAVGATTGAAGTKADMGGGGGGGGKNAIGSGLGGSSEYGGGGGGGGGSTTTGQQGGTGGCGQAGGSTSGGNATATGILTLGGAGGGGSGTGTGGNGAQPGGGGGGGGPAANSGGNGGDGAVTITFYF